MEGQYIKERKGEKGQEEVGVCVIEMNRYAHTASFARLEPLTTEREENKTTNRQPLPPRESK
jgi:hypothetical protein